MPPNRLSHRKTRRRLVYRGFPSTVLLLIKQEGIGNTNNTLQYQLVRSYSRITAMTGRRPLEKRSHLHCSGPCKWTDTSINPKAARPQNKLAVSLRDRPPLHFWDQPAAQRRRMRKHKLSHRRIQDGQRHFSSMDAVD
ncbi:hypothetical protein FVEG_16537 [Fusarium verticillioides 7600]|uniref:Uncharacterized protein n=1 Tax=Gibberella moniliformis (strain M3125 / FGSC 7600) TaxID=334819 RepID=W7ME20_GIBM7|nr:hypothetical protein FVEG_16537 [Fusarium verticillioides 7600]EWG49823.1 hypothetical protein FVEG_16537 [Fusarium verticillioides 7600]